MIVMKFGGSSVSDAARMRRVGTIITNCAPQKPVIVISALRGATDALMELARSARQGARPGLEGLRERHRLIAGELGADPPEIPALFDELSDLLHGIELLRELTPRTMDRVAGFGEKLSARLLADHLTRSGFPASAIDADKAGLLTDDRFGAANPLPEADELLRKSLGNVQGIPIVTGFIGRTKGGEATTLGRNGSDYTATILGAALGAAEVQIWSDTDGIMTADPRLVPEAVPLETLSFEEACELAYYGGKVLHPHTLLPAVRSGIPIRVLNSFKPDHPGTRILARAASAPAGVRSIVFKRHQHIVNVSSPRMASGPGFLERIFSGFAHHEVSVNMIATSEVTVSATADGARGLDALAAELSEEFEVTVDSGRALICVVGDAISSTPGVAGDVFSAVKDAGVNILMISQGASRNNIAFAVSDSDVEKTVAALHRRFFPGSNRG